MVFDIIRPVRFFSNIYEKRSLPKPLPSEDEIIVNNIYMDQNASSIEASKWLLYHIKFYKCL